MADTDPKQPGDGDPALMERMLEPVRRTLWSLAESVLPAGPGWALKTRSLPSVWSLNQLRFAGSVSFADAVALADEHQRDLGYRHLVIEDERNGADLERQFGAAGWTADLEVCMVLADPPSPGAPDVEVSLLSEDQSLSLMRMWLAERHAGISGEALEQLVEYVRREGRLWDEQSFGVVADDGSPLAVTKLRSDATTAWVEDVYTAPEARRRGHARALVTHVTTLAQRARPDLTFIMADDNDWPKHLYASIGFRPVARTHTFHRVSGLST
jgi:GNAT superfamily N-acetyltransferase